MVYFPQPFTFNLFVSFYLKNVSYREHIVGFCFFIQTDSLLFTAVFNPLIFNVIIDKFGLRLAFAICFLFVSSVDRTSRQKFSKNKEDLTNIIKHLNLIDIHRTSYLTTAECTFFSRRYGAFTYTGHLLSYQTSLNKLKNIYTEYVLWN